MTALNFGAVITELKTSDRSGNMENVVAAFPDIMDYERQQGPYLNAVVSPVAGRIAYGSYSMENTVHQLSINNGCHHLHGGTGGISRQLFHVEEEEQMCIRDSHNDAGGYSAVYPYQYHLLCIKCYLYPFTAGSLCFGIQC